MNSWHTKVPVRKGQGGAAGGVSLTILSIKPVKRSRKAAVQYSMVSRGRVELVVVELGEASTDWFTQRYGGVVMIAGRAFIPADQVVELSERPEFVSRARAD
jgi:hypothetical protein